MISEYLERFLVPIDDPGSRLFHLNLLLSALLILIWMALSQKEISKKSLQKLFFRKKYWWNHSTKIDYKFYFFNSALKVFLFIPFLDFSFHISRFVSETLVSIKGDFYDFAPVTISLFIFTTLAFVWDDFLRFIQHYLMHKIPFLWKIHSTHHSARIMTPMTLFRNHPLESAIATVRNSLSLGVSTGVFIFLFQAQLSVMTLLGVNLFGFLFNLLGANLRHSHIPIRLPECLEKIVISPLQHQIHHSRQTEHWDKNMGVSLAIWDLMAGTWVSSKNIEQLKFGIRERKRQSFIQEMKAPL
jgi:sterol desaturase/sphingolipid hydroxylase (fatty acid hydroxylase superfamily)